MKVRAKTLGVPTEGRSLRAIKKDLQARVVNNEHFSCELDEKTLKLGEALRFKVETIAYEICGVERLRTSVNRLKEQGGWKRINEIVRAKIALKSTGKYG
ncbi:MAG: hypothetical protein JW891_04720 [Candidatus Lokiarchaeota archaeon]|nr:hypothetical protein [Candidatus Lokiarchaeota archaeon]